jgi:hypothetical protein
MFDSDYVDQLIARNSRQALWRPSDWYLLVTTPERAAQRAWIEAATAHLAPWRIQRLRSRLERNRGFTETLNELALLAILNATDSYPAYEKGFGALEPDFTLHDAAGSPTAIVELHTKSRPQSATDTERRWVEMVKRVERIPVPWIVFVDTGDVSTPQPPTSGEAKLAERTLKEWLLRTSTATGHSVVIGSNRYSVVERARGGLRAQLRFPFDSSTYTTYDVLAAIDIKERRYAGAAEKAKVPCAVVLAGEPACPISLDMVRSALKGTVSMSLAFDILNVNMSVSVSGIKIKATEEPERFDPGLSAVGWLEPGTDDPGELTIFALRSAARTFPIPYGPKVRVEEV